MDIADIYKLLSEQCRQFKELTDNFHWKYVPMREVGDDMVYDEFYENDSIIQIKTKPVRSSIVRRANPEVYTKINDALIKRGHASRIHHMFTTSTKGQNTLFKLDKNYSVMTFPIGEFKYSYVPNDFNGYINFNMFSDLMVNHTVIEEQDDIDIMVDQYEEYIKKEFPDTNYMMTNVNNMKKELKKLDMVNSSNYKDAFKMEYELWFNANSYYVLSANTFGNLVQYIKNGA